jgi:hypothetical protein
MSQLYLQRFEYRAAAKADFDQTWQTALQTHLQKQEIGVGSKRAYVTSRAMERLEAAMY